MATLFNEKDMENLVLKCDFENNITYDNPTDMIGPNGNKNYAYVTLVMLGDRYVPAAIVLAYSLRKLNTQADLVVLITNDVSIGAQKVLKTYFDHVINVTYVHIRNWRTQKQPHRKYLDFVFTKFHLFNLTQYKKILLIDADAIVLKYPDHLFTLNAPAGCYLKDKDLFIAYDSAGNYVLPSNGKIKWYEEYCKCCGHGQLIPKGETDKILVERGNSGIGGGLMLLEPRKGELEDIIRDVTRGKGWELVSKKFAWPEQQYLTYRYSGKWTGINPIFFGLQGYPHWKILYGLQYGGDKPFFLDSKFPIEIRIQYPDYILWHDLFKEILNDNPTFTNEECLKEAMKMNSHFINKNKYDANRIRYNDKVHFKKDKNKIIKLNKINRININDNINKSQTKYLYTDISIDYNNLKLQPMFPDIGEYDFYTPIANLQNYFSKSESDYYNDLLKSIEDIKNNNSKKSLNDFDNIDSQIKDIVITNYIQSRESIFIITIWTYGIKYMNDLIKFLQNNGNVYYDKTLTFTRNGLSNLMFTMYDEFAKESREYYINKKLGYDGITQLDNQIGIIVFDNVQNKKLSGKDSDFKRIIRDFIVNKLKYDNPNANSIPGNDIIHINDNFYQSINYAHFLFNKNSLEFLEKININRLLNPELNKESTLLNTYKKFIYENFSQQEIMRFCLIDNSIFSSYGITLDIDINGIVMNIQSNDKNELKFEEIVCENFVDNDTKFKFINIDMENSKCCCKLDISKNKTFLDVLNINSLSEIVLNPKYHYYHNGLKHCIIDIELARKFIRFEQKDYADFIMLYLKFKHVIDNKIMLNKNMTIKLPNYVNSNAIPNENDILENIHKKYIKDDYFNINQNVIKQFFKIE